MAVKLAGGVGMLLVNVPDGDASIIQDKHAVPSVHLIAENGLLIQEYIRNTVNAQATILASHYVQAVAPRVSEFSSRGPVVTTPHLYNNVAGAKLLDILKPDILAPGVSMI
jgi:hypothetical protein